MDGYTEGLRCQDVNTGLRNIDATSPVLTPVKKTRLVGMAADLAALVRSKEIVEDITVLESVAAAELDIPSTSFDAVVQVLESAELVELTRRGGQVTGLTSEVPHHRDLYETLGREWRGRQPSQLEEELLAVVNQLAKGPVAAESLTSVVGVENSDVDRILSLGSDAELIKSVSGIDGTILYSPYTAFENPKLLADMAEQHGNDRLLEEFAAVREHQGLAVTSEAYPMLWDAIGRGLIIAPSIELPGGAGDMPFATLPYTLDRELLVGEKPVLEKVLAVIACVRCGEKFGGYSNLVDAAVGVNALLRWGELEPHESSARQYRLMRNKGIITFGPDHVPWGRWVTPTLVDTPENRRALEIARDLLTLGEALTGREAEKASQALSSDARYLGPLKTVKATKPRLMHKESEYSKIMAAFMGYGTLG
ncbi:hypothetical protein ACIQGO_24065 [Streptomyces shenzhenensis]|uniref:hypothetical protein n=1 Tax=Streptomyces shenzhenensis TaxID=943815 RepID=UPI003827D287